MGNIFKGEGKWDKMHKKMKNQDLGEFFLKGEGKERKCIKAALKALKLYLFGRYEL